MAKKARGADAVVFFQRRGITQCPKCVAKPGADGRPGRSWAGDVRCYKTEGTLHYMECRICGHKFKAQDPDEVAQFEDHARKEAAARLKFLREEAAHAQKMAEIAQAAAERAAGEKERLLALARDAQKALEAAEPATAGKPAEGTAQ